MPPMQKAKKNVPQGRFGRISWGDLVHSSPKLRHVREKLKCYFLSVQSVEENSEEKAFLAIYSRTCDRKTGLKISLKSDE